MQNHSATVKKIYLAIPYNDNSHELRIKRFEIANQVSAELFNQGHLVFSPISHSHPIAEQCELPKGFEFWQKWNYSFIDWCDELWVVAIDGWIESRGVRGEMDYAKEHGKGIIFYHL